MKILQVISTLNPTFGGPSEALRQITDALRRNGHQADTITLDAPGASFLDDFPGPVTALGPSLGAYCYNRKLIPWLVRNAPMYDAVVASCLWQYQAYAVWKAAKKVRTPYFVFVHGALDPWFKRTYPLKHLKKWMYWALAGYWILRDASAVFFTCEEERLLARHSFWLYQAREAIVDCGINVPSEDAASLRSAFLRAYPHLKGKRVILFLGRIHPKKGCDLLIEAFAASARKDANLHLVMAGPDETDLQPRLAEIAKAVGVDDRVTWTGMLAGEQRFGAYYAADVFALPSHSENFGVVVAEALARGLPVLISDKVNIWREVKGDGAGLVEPDTSDGARSLLSRWLALTDTERTQMRQRARACFLNRFDVRQSAQRLIEALKVHARPNDIGVTNPGG